MSNLKKTVFYHIFHSKTKEDEYKIAHNVPRMHEWELVEVRDEPAVQVLQLFPWEITKVLVASDLGYLPGLELNRDLAHAHILKHWDAQLVSRVLLHKESIQITIRDIDTCTDHDVFFRKCFDNENFCIQEGWVRNFVCRRCLMVGMQIGMYWDTRTSTFRFSVLNEAPQTPARSRASPFSRLS